jgi:hypothetical protein
MATLADFYDRVSNAIRRGSIYNSVIANYTYEAMEELEQRHSFRHMWEVQDKTVTTGNRDMTFTDRIKSIRFIRRANDDGSLSYVSKVEPEDVSGVETGFPDGYFFKSTTEIRFDNEMDQDYTFEVGWYKFTTPADDMVWLTHMRGLLLAATIVEMAPLLRDPDLVQLYGAQQAKKLAAVLEFDAELQYDGADMVMSPFTREMYDEGSMV